MDFTQSFLQGVQQGQQRASAQKRQEQEAEEFDLKKQMLKVEMQKLDIAQKVAQRKAAFEEAEGMKNFDVPAGPGGTPPTSVPVNIPAGGYGEAPMPVMAPTLSGMQQQKAKEAEAAQARAEALSKVFVPGKGFVDREVFTAEEQARRAAEKAAADRAEMEARFNQQNQIVDKQIGAADRRTDKAIAAADKRYGRGSSIPTINDLPTDEQEIIRNLAQRVTEGEMTTSDARGLLGGVHGGRGKAFTQALIDTGSRVAPAVVRTGLQDLKRTQNLLIEIRELVDEIASSTSPEERLKKAVILENYTKSVGTMLARGFGERGVVTDADRNAAIGLVPGWKSTNFAPQFAQDKLAILDKMIERNSEALVKGYFERIPTGGKPPAATPSALPAPPTATFKIIEVK